ncbi:hypothetical protein Syun_027807 [Stephania yunnanensis]|uniref:Uncharacterized protein n=1 Tax=Stephania yunnanensis TaxID=152371 RepID=A0AAP0HQJ8_9MAGN
MRTRGAMLVAPVVQIDLVVQEEKVTSIAQPRVEPRIIPLVIPVDRPVVVEPIKEDKLLSEFRKNSPQRFYGGFDLEKNDEWILNHEKIHMLLNTPENLNVSLSTHYLESNALMW